MAQDVIIEEDIVVKKKPIKAPSKKWRNKWVAIKAGIVEGKPVTVGNILWGKMVWPSYEIALEKSEKEIEDPRSAAYFKNPTVEHVDAYPEA